MAFTTFVFFQVFNLPNVRSESASVFSRETLTNRTAFLAAGAVLLLQVAVVTLEVPRKLLTTTTLTSGQWLTAAAVASSILWIGRAAEAFGSPSPARRSHKARVGRRAGARRRKWWSITAAAVDE